MAPIYIEIIFDNTSINNSSNQDFKNWQKFNLHCFHCQYRAFSLISYEKLKIIYTEMAQDKFYVITGTVQCRHLSETSYTTKTVLGYHSKRLFAQPEGTDKFNVITGTV